MCADVKLRSRLLAWYDKARRDLPWRRTRDPYAIWVSEIMCQQTRVDTVIPYYERFLKRFPTLRSLAKADEDEVLSLWSGLGYYRRARLLHKGVREVVSEYGAKMPVDPAQRLSLPGIGRYTAGAIGSIAFDQEEPIVDGNVMRVLSRLFAIDSPLGRRDTEKKLWELAQDLVRGERPGDFNQAMMELGATVCTPTSPSCSACPVRTQCAAYKDNRVHELPVVPAKKAPKKLDLVAVIAHTEKEKEGVWLVKSEVALFGGLWNLPMKEGRGRAAAESLLLDAGLGGSVAVKSAADVVHVLSHRHMRVQVWEAVVKKKSERADRKYVSRKGLTRLGVSRLTQKVLAARASQ